MSLYISLIDLYFTIEFKTLHDIACVQYLNQQKKKKKSSFVTIYCLCLCINACIFVHDTRLGGSVGPNSTNLKIFSTPSITIMSLTDVCEAELSVGNVTLQLP